MAGYTSPLVSPTFPPGEEGLAAMETWMDGLTEVALRRRWVTNEDRAVYQAVRHSFNSRKLRAKNRDDKEWRDRHNAATAASRPLPCSAQAKRITGLNTLNKREKRAGMFLLNS